MNRIEQKFKELKKKKKKAFIAFITAGDPSLQATEKLVKAFEHAGVDIVELGVPFSDPLADGPTIQASSQRALEKGVNLNQILDTVKKIRHSSQIPLALMTYYNPIFCFGEERFFAMAKMVGVDGVIVPDLPPEEAHSLIKYARKQDIATIFFISPTTTKKRMRLIAKASSGFIYYVSLTGVTGIRQSLSESIVKQVRLAKRFTNKPICVGFGISNSKHVASVSKGADGVIVGSTIVNKIAQCGGRQDMVSKVLGVVRQLSKGLN